MDSVTRSNLQTRYKSGRSNLAIVVVFTAINLILAMVKAEVMFLFSAFFPYIVMTQATHFFSMNAVMPVLYVLAVAPLGLLGFCFIKSADEKKYRWLSLAAILMAADTVYMVAYVLTYGFEPSFFMGFVFHAVVLFPLIMGSIAGKKLAEAEPESSALSGEGEEAASSDLAEAEEESEKYEAAGYESEGESAKYYRYDVSYASKNTKKKAIQILLTVVLYLVIGISIPAATAIFMIESDTIPFEVAITAIIIALVIPIIIMAWRLIKLSPYLEASTAHFVLPADSDTLIRSKNEGFVTLVVPLEDMSIIEVYDEGWTVSYTGKRGKEKKMVIPNAYPGLEEYMKTVPMK